MPTIGAFLQLLPRGLHGRDRIAQPTPRSSRSSKGKGRTRIGDETFEWGPRDIFVAPSWRPVSHRGGAGIGGLQLLRSSGAAGARPVARRGSAARLRIPIPEADSQASENMEPGLDGVMKNYRIGQIVPSSNTTMETEIPAMFRARESVAPERFTFHSSRMRMKKVTQEELAAMDAESTAVRGGARRCARGRDGLRVPRRHHVHGQGLSLHVGGAAARGHRARRARPRRS